MFYWMPYPFVRIVLSLIAGILLQIHFPSLVPEEIAMVFLCIFGTLLPAIVLINARQKRAVVNSGLAILGCAFVLGYLNTGVRRESRHSDHILNLESIQAYTAVVAGSHELARSSWKQLVKVRSVRIGDDWHRAGGKVLLYYDTASVSTPYRYGDVLLIQGAPSAVRGPANPHAFDYRKYLSYRNIYHQHFTRDAPPHHFANKPPSRLMDFAIRARLWALNILSQHIRGEREQAIAAALVLGTTDNLDDETTAAYAASGAMHVLAVSGLHVGIIYLLAATVLKPLRRYRWGQWAIAVCSLVILWSYACVTGLSPSVLRAVTMFSFVVVGQPLKYRTNIYNTLAASAFFLLLCDPCLIMAVGFQLSYLAVLAIVYLHPLLYNLIEPESRLLDYVWNISAVSIAAQAGTFPIGLFYFHQFPTYFLVANLFVIPFAFAILLGGLATIALSWVPLIGPWTGVMVEGIIRLLNYLIFAVKGLPFAVVDGVSPSLAQCVLLTSVTIASALFLQYRRASFAISVLVLMVLFGGSLWHFHVTTFNKAKLVVYQVSRHSVVDMIKGEEVFYFADSAFAGNVQAGNFQVAPNRLALGVNRIVAGNTQPFVRHFKEGTIIRWQSRSILIIREVPAVAEPVVVDFLIVSGAATRNLAETLKKIHADNLILDSSNSYFVTDKVLNSLTPTVQAHSVWHHGAFEVNW